MHSGNDVIGDSVNIASRIQPIADPEGVCVSQQVYDQIRNKLTNSLVKLDQKYLKNLQFPLDVYKVVMPWEETHLTPDNFRGETSHRLAVLPFTNISPDPTDEYFADGLTEELISTLSTISGLRVIARTSVMKYKGLGRGVHEIGKELNVHTAIQGSVRKAGERLRIGVQLVDVQTEEYLWVQKYDRDLQDIFAIQSEIAQQVAEALTIQLRTGEKGNLERRATDSTAAHSLYLKGRHYWNERTREGMDKAAKYFEQAIKLDPKFALAYAALADCNVVSPSYGWGEPREAFPKAREYALKAIEIDRTLAEPHASLAMVYADYEYRWREAEEQFKQAVLLKASYATGYHWYSIVLAFMGRYSDSYEQAKLASALDPLSQIISVNVGVALLGLGKIKEAIKQFERIREEDPNYVTAHNYLGWAYYLDSRTDEAIG
ncbi:MAG: tetratricopeptide repeat protein, partial [Nitrososphaerales archaeon]